MSGVICIKEYKIQIFSGKCLNRNLHWCSYSLTSLQIMSLIWGFTRHQCFLEFYYSEKLSLGLLIVHIIPTNQIIIRCTYM